MHQPQGFINPQYPNYVCKLHKVIYGLKQAPREWFAQLSSWLLGYGFQASKVDASLFVLTHGDLRMYLLVYVDDFIITASKASVVDQFISDLSLAFPVKDLGTLSYFLGLEITQMNNGLLLSQRKYIKDLLTRSKMLHAKPVTSPMAAALKLSKFDSPSFDDVTLFRSIVGSLQYLSLTRPDISYAVNKVCQFKHTPKLPHWVAIKRILRYLKATINHGLFFSSQSSFKLQAYSDADWVGCPNDRRSMGGFCVFLSNHLISWSSKKQRTVARSSTKAEYKYVASSAAKLIWLQTLIFKLGLPFNQVPILWCDNIQG
ncbi:uncharacterized mitochondrial protein AtMg00810-like [Juglans microcarpa x Juglans regia]|uniref:uncharacterized mitochondrial protein AtMg00810-like n=1 Tax=Juglans microcarpa x Juglans regia TaxID=2249226 RepID=UPI001B7F15E3|nr:uncharacterized mitochondrial protein AtMg00810-like [Juglans microcarpa x Juglans regia]